MTSPTLTIGPSSARRAVLRRRIRWLVAATISYNVVEAGVAITAGALASSTALIAFGLDSVVEVGSAAVVAWQFSAADPSERERTALRLIAVSFFALAGYVMVESLRALLGAGEADHSHIGIGLAALSLLVMPGQRDARLVVGRPARRARHRGRGREGGTRGMAWRRVLSSGRWRVPAYVNMPGIYADPVEGRARRRVTG